MPYFQQGVTIPIDTQRMLFLMRMDRRAVRCYELIVTEGSGLPEEFQMTRYMCTARVNWCGSRRTVPRAYGLVKRQTGLGFGNNGGILIEDRWLDNIDLCRRTVTADCRVKHPTA